MIIYFFLSIFFPSKMFAFFILMIMHYIHKNWMLKKWFVFVSRYEYGWIGDGIRWNERKENIEYLKELYICSFALNCTVYHMYPLHSTPFHIHMYIMKVRSRSRWRKCSKNYYTTNELFHVLFIYFCIVL